MRTRVLSLVFVLAGCTGLQGPTPEAEAARARHAALSDAGAPALQVVVEARQRGDILRLAARGADGTGTWLASDGTSFALDRGMLVATRGLDGELMAADVSGVAALVRGRRNGQAARFQSYLTGDHQIVTRSYVCDVRNVQAFALDLGARVVPSRFVTETCHGVDDDFTNSYWVSPTTGEIWQSRQLAHPRSGLIAFRQVLD